MNGSEDIFPYQPFIQQNRIFVVITFPGHEADEGILTQRDFTVRSRRTICQNLSLCNVFASVYNRSLVDASALVGTLELFELKGLFLVGFIRQQSNGVCGNCRNHTITRCKHTNARVYSCLVFHTGSDKRPFGLEQRYCLSLHVRAHQRTVCVIVFQERNHRSCNRNDHLRGNIHEVNAVLLHFQNLFPITSRNLMICKVSVFGQRFVCLCNNVIIFYISGHINNFVCYNTSCLVYSPIRSFNKAIFVDSCECCQIRNQTDVRTFWRFNRAHSSVMAIMYVTNFKPCTVSGQTARTQCGQTTLMGQFCQRVVLIHEL